MAGSHKVRMTRGGSDFWFEVTAKPANLLSRIPYLGPFLAYNLGRNPRFVVEVRYLGYATVRLAPIGDEFIPDPNIMLGSEEAPYWVFDLALHIDEDYIQHGDDLRVDLHRTTIEKREQKYVTREWPLTRPGRAELQIGSPNPYVESLYSFEVRDVSTSVAVVLLTTMVALVSGVIGGIVGRLL